MDLHQLRSLPADHIDLVLTAAIEFGVIAAPSGAPRPQQVLTAMAQRLGTGLFLRNQLVDPAGYRYRPVDGPLDVRDVLKACHAAQFAYRDTKLWVGSTEQRVVDGAAKAAAMRMPGYELSPWVWTRPAEEAIGFAPGSWHPTDLVGVEWVDDLDEFTGRWATSRVVILTFDALEVLPVLPARPRVYLVVEAEHSGAAIGGAGGRQRLSIDSVLVWPEAARWLREELLI